MSTTKEPALVNDLMVAVKLRTESRGRPSPLSPYRDEIRDAFEAGVSAAAIADICTKRLSTKITKDRVLRFLHAETDLAPRDRNGGHATAGQTKRTPRSRRERGTGSPSDPRFKALDGGRARQPRDEEQAPPAGDTDTHPPLGALGGVAGRNQRKL